MAGKKFYAIAVGAVPGIYDNWPAAQAQVKGFCCARFKGFATRPEAEAWLANPVGGQGKGRGGGVAFAADDTEPREGEVTIYTDGGARNNPGPGGYGIVIIENGSHLELSGGFQHTTNNRMELMGCIVALRQLKKRDKPVTLYTDSRYVVDGITKGWARGWRKRGWLKGDGQPALNPDLWGELLDLVDGLKISFRWVKGHAGHPQNERCDELVLANSARRDLPVDTGYQR